MSTPALAYVATPDALGPAVLVLHSWWGLTASFTQYADHLGEHGFLAGCVDLYDGHLATTPEEAATLRSRPRRVPMYRTMLAGAQQLLGHPRSEGDRIGLVGFSMGGHWAVWLAQRPDLPAGAVVIHYATRVATTSSRPVPTLAHFAEKDPFVTPAGRRAMERSLARFGWPYTAVDHPGTRHWFAESADEAYDPTAAARAFAQSTRHLRDAL